jgi:hypothetical protein
MPLNTTVIRKRVLSAPTQGLSLIAVGRCAPPTPTGFPDRAKMKGPRTDSGPITARNCPTGASALDQNFTSTPADKVACRLRRSGYQTPADPQATCACCSIAVPAVAPELQV